MGHSEAMQARLVEERLARARVGSVAAYYELGVDYSVGRHGIEIDLVEAHKWFNLAALSGDRRAQTNRAEVAAEMSAFEVAEAQRQARAWLAAGRMPIAA
jgi:TPR repeat protein